MQAEARTPDCLIDKIAHGLRSGARRWSDFLFGSALIDSEAGDKEGRRFDARRRQTRARKFEESLWVG